MIRSLLATLAVLALATTSPAQEAPEAFAAEYVFRLADPAAAGASAEVACELTLRGLDGPVELTLPERIAYAVLPEPRLTGDVQLEGGGTLERRGPYAWMLEPEGSRAELRWTVPLDHRRQPEAARSSYEFPYVRADHGMLQSGTLALAPTSLPADAVTVRFELPEGWPVLAPWPEARPGVYAPPGWRSLHNDLVAVGAWDVVRPDVDGVAVAAAFAPGQRALREAVGPSIARIVEHELSLFGRVPNGHYLFLFGAPDPNGYGGSVKANSMTLFVSPDLPADFAAEGVLHLVAHEFHHTWYFASDEPFDDEELHFVMEGFTDWYAQRVPWDVGLFDDATLLRRLEDVLVGYDHATASTDLTLVEAGGPPFFSDRDAYTQVYGGGLALALLCELALARHDDPEGLDGFLRQLTDGPRRPGEPTPGLEAFLAWLEPRAGKAFAERARALVNTPGRMDLPAAFASLGVDLTRRTRPADTSQLQANLSGTTLGGIDPRDVAARLGLQPGDVLRRVNGRDVADEWAVRDAWARPVDGRVQVVYERDGARRQLDTALPEDVTYSLSPGVLDGLRRG